MSTVKLSSDKNEKNENKYLEIKKQLMNDLGLSRIINAEMLQNVQDNIAKITGLSMVTVDSKGVPITSETSFSNFCKIKRETCKENCFFSDAYGGLKAAISNAPYVYQCPAGLVDCAVPITVNGQHMGAVLMGQVRCPESDSASLENVKTFVKENISEERYLELMDEYQKTPTLQISKINMIAKLIHFMINEMVERQTLLLLQSKTEKEMDRLQSELKNKDAQLRKIMNNGKQQLKAELTPQFLISIMNDMSSLSVIEGAKQTNELVCLFSNMLRYNFNTKEQFVDLDKELANLKDYLSIQQIRFGDRFDYKIDVRCSTENKKIPYLVFFPFVENAIVHGILPQNQNGMIIIMIDEVSAKDYSIIIQDNGVGMDQTDADQLLAVDGIDYSNTSALKGISIYNTRRRLIGYFGEDYDIQIKAERDHGCTVIATIPLKIKDVDEDDKA